MLEKNGRNKFPENRHKLYHVRYMRYDCSNLAKHWKQKTSCSIGISGKYILIFLSQTFWYLSIICVVVLLGFFFVFFCCFFWHFSSWTNVTWFLLLYSTTFEFNQSLAKYLSYITRSLSVGRFSFVLAWA